MTRPPLISGLILAGGAGNDTLYGLAGNDTLDGGDDNDILFGGAGNDTIYGGAGNEFIVPGDGSDLVYGGSGINTIRVSGSDLASDTFVIDRNIRQFSDGFRFIHCCWPSRSIAFYVLVLQPARFVRALQVAWTI